MVGSAVESVFQEAERTSTDLIVLGARGRSPAVRFLLGSVSDAVVHRARCAVLVEKIPKRG